MALRCCSLNLHAASCTVKSRGTGTPSLLPPYYGCGRSVARPTDVKFSASRVSIDDRASGRVCEIIRSNRFLRRFFLLFNIPIGYYLPKKYH